jgi:hypothetical protein
MTITPYQIIVPLISLFLVAYAWSLVMRQKKTLWEGCLWTLFWGVISCLALFPSSLQYVSRITGIRRNETAVVVTAIGVLFFMMFYVIIRIEELQQRITKLTREDALKDLK